MTGLKIAAGINRRYASIHRKLLKNNEDLKSLQEECPHHTPTYTYKGNNGNYDPSADSYWINWSCNDCGKRWNSEQNQSEIQKFPNAIQAQ